MSGKKDIAVAYKLSKKHKSAAKESALEKPMPEPKLMAKGGAVSAPCTNCGYAEGGEVADESPNDFDYTELEAGSDDEGQEDTKEESDSLVSRILRKRLKK